MLTILLISSSNVLVMEITVKVGLGFFAKDYQDEN